MESQLTSGSEDERCETSSRSAFSVLGEFRDGGAGEDVGEDGETVGQRLSGSSLGDSDEISVGLVRVQLAVRRLLGGEQGNERLLDDWDRRCVADTSPLFRLDSWRGNVGLCTDLDAQGALLDRSRGLELEFEEGSTERFAEGEVGPGRECSLLC